MRLIDADDLIEYIKIWDIGMSIDSCLLYTSPSPRD